MGKAQNSKGRGKGNGADAGAATSRASRKEEVCAYLTSVLKISSAQQAYGKMINHSRARLDELDLKKADARRCCIQLLHDAGAAGLLPPVKKQKGNRDADPSSRAERMFLDASDWSVPAAQTPGVGSISLVLPSDLDGVLPDVPFGQSTAILVPGKIDRSDAVYQSFPIMTKEAKARPVKKYIPSTLIQLSAPEVDHVKCLTLAAKIDLAPARCINWMAVKIHDCERFKDLMQKQFADGVRVVGLHDKSQSAPAKRLYKPKSQVEIALDDDARTFFRELMHSIAPDVSILSPLQHLQRLNNQRGERVLSICLAVSNADATFLYQRSGLDHVTFQRQAYGDTLFVPDADLYNSCWIKGDKSLHEVALDAMRFPSAAGCIRDMRRGTIMIRLLKDHSDSQNARSHFTGDSRPPPTVRYRLDSVPACLASKEQLQSFLSGPDLLWECEVIYITYDSRVRSTFALAKAHDDPPKSILGFNGNVMTITKNDDKKSSIRQHQVCIDPPLAKKSDVSEETSWYTDTTGRLPNDDKHYVKPVPKAALRGSLAKSLSGLASYYPPARHDGDANMSGEQRSNSGKEEDPSANNQEHDAQSLGGISNMSTAPARSKPPSSGTSSAEWAAINSLKQELLTLGQRVDANNAAAAAATAQLTTGLQQVSAENASSKAEMQGLAVTMQAGFSQILAQMTALQNNPKAIAPTAPSTPVATRRRATSPPSGRRSANSKNVSTPQIGRSPVSRSPRRSSSLAASPTKTE